MVLTPRLRSHIADPSAMETDMSPEPSVSYNTRKRHRSGTYDPSHWPELPKLSGKIILEVFTHKSLRLACHATYQDNERLSVLGHHILEMITTQLLFCRRQKLRKETIEAQRRALLSTENIDTWSKWYCLRDELRYDPSIQSVVEEPEQGRLLFLAYVAAVYHERGLVDVQKWIGALLRVTTDTFKELQGIDLEPEEKRIKVEEPAPGPSVLSMKSPPPVKAAIDFAMKHYNPYANQPTPPQSAPPPLPPLPPPASSSPFASNPLAPAQPHLAFLPLFNQTASQRGLSVEYPATFVGPSHAGKWNVTCIVNGIERGKGSGSSKQLAKEQAARTAYYTMGWAPRG
ncbi:hypothetical protein V8B97DRAFT_1969127 [Scleroderma yunnanense]